MTLDDREPRAVRIFTFTSPLLSILMNFDEVYSARSLHLETYPMTTGTPLIGIDLGTTFSAVAFVI